MTVQSPIPDFAAARDRDGRKPVAAAGRDRCRRARGDGRGRARAIRPRQRGPSPMATARSRLGTAASSLRRRCSACCSPRCGRARPARARRRRRHRLFGRGAGAHGPRRDRARKFGSARRARPRARRRIVEGPLEAGWQQGRAVRQILIDGAVEIIPDPIVDQLADGGRLGTALGRPRGHAAHRRPQVGQCVRLSFPGRCRRPGSPGLRPPACIHILRGVGPECFASFSPGR